MSRSLKLDSQNLLFFPKVHEKYSSIFADNNSLTSITNLPTSVTSLSISYNNIAFLSDLNSLLPNLQVLNLSHNRLISIEGLKNCINLNVLIISDNFIGDDQIPALSNLKKIKVLDISANHLRNNDFLSEMQNLEEFWAIGNEFQQWTLECNLDNLKIMVVDKNKIKSVEFIKEFLRLEYFSCQENKIKSIKGIEKCQYLSEFNFSFNNLRELPKGIQQLLKIDKVHAKNNKICAVQGLKSVKMLDISYNRLTYLPDFGENLKEIYANNNNLSKIEKFCSINIADLSNNNLRNLECVQNCYSLEILKASNNKFENFEIIFENIKNCHLKNIEIDAFENDYQRIVESFKDIENINGKNIRKIDQTNKALDAKQIFGHSKNVELNEKGQIKKEKFTKEITKENSKKIKFNENTKQIDEKINPTEDKLISFYHNKPLKECISNTENDKASETSFNLPDLNSSHQVTLTQEISPKVTQENFTISKIFPSMNSPFTNTEKNLSTSLNKTYNSIFSDIRPSALSSFYNANRYNEENQEPTGRFSYEFDENSKNKEKLQKQNENFSNFREKNLETTKKLGKMNDEELENTILKGKKRICRKKNCKKHSKSERNKSLIQGTQKTVEDRGTSPIIFQVNEKNRFKSSEKKQISNKITTNTSKLILEDSFSNNLKPINFENLFHYAKTPNRPILASEKNSVIIFNVSQSSQEFFLISQLFLSEGVQLNSIKKSYNYNLHEKLGNSSRNLNKTLKNLKSSKILLFFWEEPSTLQIIFNNPQGFLSVFDRKCANYSKFSASLHDFNEFYSGNNLIILCLVDSESVQYLSKDTYTAVELEKIIPVYLIDFNLH